VIGAGVSPPEGEPPTIGFQRVLCGVDGSTESIEAARKALEIGDKRGAYWIVSVWNPAIAVHADLVDELRERSLAALRAARAAFPERMSRSPWNFGGGPGVMVRR
jgi:hypothetical protein